MEFISKYMTTERSKKILLAAAAVFLIVLTVFADTSFVALFMKLCALSLFLYVFPQQLSMALSERDFLSGLRWRILALLSTAIISLIPSIWLQFMVLLDLDPGVLRNVSTVTTNLSILAFAILLVSILKYKPEEGVEK